MENQVCFKDSLIFSQTCFCFKNDIKKITAIREKIHTDA
jgi:hypothetical protein